MPFGNVFISHKIRDKEISEVVAQFIRNESGNNVEVFFSSDARFRNPPGGTPLHEALAKALEDAGVLILVHTGEMDRIDWSYCSYECGFAMRGNVPIYVLQCGDEVPAFLRHLVRYNARLVDDVDRFVAEYLLSPKFFPHQEKPLTNFSRHDPIVKSKALQLHSLLEEKIKNIAEGPREWSPWPYFRLRIDSGDARKITDQTIGRDSRLSHTDDIVRTRAVVAESKAADTVFGLGVERNDSFSRLLESWQTTHQQASLGWYNGLVAQVHAFANRGFQQLDDERIPAVMAEASRLPVVTRTLTYHDGAVEFDIQLYDVGQHSPQVRDKMIPKRHMYFKVLDSTNAKSLHSLFAEMSDQQRHRLPLLDGNGRILYMVHRSMISECIARAALKRADIQNLTLADILGDDELRCMFEQTIVFVTPEATVAQAKQALKNLPGARDIFVTANGTKDEPVLGMLTVTDLVETL